MRNQRKPRTHSLPGAAGQPRRVGVPDRQIPDRSGVVVLPLLAARIFEPDLRAGSFRPGAAAGGDLYGVDGGLDRRRLDLLHADQARLERQRRAQNGDADLRGGGDRVRFSLTRRDNLWVAVTLISIAAAAHQGWSAKFSICRRMFSRGAPSPPWWVSAEWAEPSAACSRRPSIGYWLDWSGGAYGPSVCLRRIAVSGSVGNHSSIGSGSGEGARKSAWPSSPKIFY